MHKTLLVIRWLFICFLSFGLAAIIVILLPLSTKISNQSAGLIIIVLGILLVYPIHKYLVDF